MQSICTSLHTDNHADTSSLNFYMANALPGAQLTASKQQKAIVLKAKTLRMICE